MDAVDVDAIATNVVVVLVVATVVAYILCYYCNGSVSIFASDER